MLNAKTIFLILASFAFFSITKAQKKSAEHDLEERLKILAPYISKKDSVGFFQTYIPIYIEAKSKKDTVLNASLLNKLGIFFYNMNQLSKGVQAYDTAIYLAENIKNEHLLITLHMNRGALNYSMNNYAASLREYKRSEDLMLRLKHSEKIGGLFGNISLLYRETGDIDNAKRYLNRAIPFIKMTNDSTSFLKTINNLGLIYKDEKNYQAADSLFKIGYHYAKNKSNLQNDFADITYNLTVVLLIRDQFEEAIQYQRELLAFVKKYKEPSWEKLVLQGLAKSLIMLKRKEEAIKYLRLSEKIPNDENAEDEDTKQSYINIAEIYMNLGWHEKAAQSFNRYFQLDAKSSKNKELSNMSKLNFEFERAKDSLKNTQEQELIKLEALRQQEKTESRLQQQKTLLSISLLGLASIVVFSFFLFKANRSKEKANAEILNQKKLITEKNKEITDSIQYAKHIQGSLLPSVKTMDKLLPQHFLFFLPKDIVSGDFYWIKEINEHETFIAVADCTGHGVPGAIMSALSIQQLNEISEHTQSPGDVLRELNSKLKTTLQHNELHAKDGLDICLCKLNKHTNTLTYAGANRNLWIINNTGVLNEIKATKTGIGGHTELNQRYEEQVHAFQKGDLAVLSSDGFADQFGGPSAKKITTKQFKNWICNDSQNDSKQIGELLKEKYLNWKNNSEQIDDVCVLGFKLV
jgi:serine phosphatase RsbU (regulator of sigma subunit)